MARSATSKTGCQQGALATRTYDARTSGAEGEGLGSLGVREAGWRPVQSPVWGRAQFRQSACRNASGPYFSPIASQRARMRTGSEALDTQNGTLLHMLLS